jgi:hypothetical protein
MHAYVTRREAQDCISGAQVWNLSLGESQGSRLNCMILDSSVYYAVRNVHQRVVGLSGADGLRGVDKIPRTIQTNTLCHMPQR